MLSSSLALLPTLILAEFDHELGNHPLYVFQHTASLCDTTAILASASTGRRYGKTIVSGPFPSNASEPALVAEAQWYLEFSQGFSCTYASERSTIQVLDHPSRCVAAYAFPVYDEEARGTSRMHVWLLLLPTVELQCLSRWLYLEQMLKTLADSVTNAAEALRKPVSADASSSAAKHKTLRPLCAILMEAVGAPSTLDFLHDPIDFMFSVALGYRMPRSSCSSDGRQYLLASCEGHADSTRLARHLGLWNITEEDRWSIFRALLTGSQILISHNRKDLEQIADAFAIALASVLPKGLRKVSLRSSQYSALPRILSLGNEFKLDITVGEKSDKIMLKLDSATMPPVVHVVVSQEEYATATPPTTASSASGTNPSPARSPTATSTPSTADAFRRRHLSRSYRAVVHYDPIVFAGSPSCLFLEEMMTLWQRFESSERLMPILRTEILSRDEPLPAVLEIPEERATPVLTEAPKSLKSRVTRFFFGASKGDETNGKKEQLTTPNNAHSAPSASKMGSTLSFRGSPGPSPPPLSQPQEPQENTQTLTEAVDRYLQGARNMSYV